VIIFDGDFSKHSPSLLGSTSSEELSGMDGSSTSVCLDRFCGRLMDFFTVSFSLFSSLSHSCCNYYCIAFSSAA
jgi:hypothetical protein